MTNFHILYAFTKSSKSSCSIFDSRLSEWAIEVIEPGSVVEYIAKYDFKTYTDTPQMARLISGFLFKEILQQFSNKINGTLNPDRSLWIYSAHDFTITNMLNALGLYEVTERFTTFFVLLIRLK